MAPPQDTHAGASDDAAAVVVHGHHSLAAAAVVVAPAVVDQGKKRKREEKHEDAADGVGTAARSEKIDVVPAADGGATDGAHRHRHRHRHRDHHRRPRESASEGTEAAAASSRDDTASARREPGDFSAVVYCPEPAPATARPKPVAVGHKRRHQQAAGDSYANDDHVAAASVAERPNGIVISGKHRHQATGGSAYADDYAAALSSPSRLVREPAAPPRHHHLPKPHKAHGAPSSSSSAAASAPPGEPGESELCLLGLEAVMSMDDDTLRSAVNEFLARDGQGHRRQQQPAAEAVKNKRLPFWRLTPEEADADLRAIDDEVEARRKAASGDNGKRRRH